MDDLLSLDFASAAPARAPGAAHKPGGAQLYGRTNFDYLSGMQSTSPSISRSASPFAANPSPALPPPTNARIGSGNIVTAKDTKVGSAGTGGDAFSSLFGSTASAGGGSNAGAGLSMAERLGKDGGTLWAGGAGGRLSPALSGGTSSRSSSPALPTASRTSSMNVVRDPWDFDLLAPASTTSSRAPPIVKSPPAIISDSLDPFDSFNHPTPISTSSPHPPTDEFDLLGLLSAPISSCPPPPPSKPSTLRSTPTSRAASPPPHILGQIVEMGFSITQAQVALVATQKGDQWDVEAALETLVLEGETEDLRRAVEEEGEGGEGRVRQRERRRSWEEVDAPVLAPRPVGRRAREAAAKARESSADGEEGSSSTVQDQANELLAQASKIGFSVFKSANAYWETGRATIAKKLEERAEGEGDHGRKKGKERERPRWMDDQVDVEEEEQVTGSVNYGGKGKGREEPPTKFIDGDWEVVDSVLPQRPSTHPAERTRPPAPPPSTRTLTPATQPSPEYRSPHRRPKPPTVESTPRPPIPSPVPVPKPKPTQSLRSVVTATPPQLSASSDHKTRGNDLFKLGRFSDADACYTQSIDALPPLHLDRIPLYNNRAIARLKFGEEKGAAEDCSQVVEFVLGPSGANGAIDFAAIDEESATLGGVVNLREQLAKALARRAKAFEAQEKWKSACDDWTTLMQGGEWLAKGAGGSKIISDGLARSRKMLAGEGGPSTSTLPNRTTKPVAAAKPEPKPVVQSSGNAVKAHRAANDAAEAEDDLRFSLKDDVDARILAWKGGKETNLRALIASLDNVLWKELGWVKVGMHELISEGQLKIRYVRAIAKVHPDKLNVGNTTVEQRMIAGGVFAGLNDAWNAAKA